jgi:hypothetical protein
MTIIMMRILFLWLLVVSCFSTTIRTIATTVVVAVNSTAASEEESPAASQSAPRRRRRQQKQEEQTRRHLQFIEGDLCRCQAEWEDFYPLLTSGQEDGELAQVEEVEQQVVKRERYPLFRGSRSGNDRQRKNHRNLQHYDYDTAMENEDNGLMQVEGIFILPTFDPFCEVPSGERQRRQRQRQRDLGVAANKQTVAASSAIVPAATSHRGNGRVEVLIGATSVVQKDGDPQIVEQQAVVEEDEDEQRDLVNCHGDNLLVPPPPPADGAGYYYGTRRNPYNNRGGPQQATTSQQRPPARSGTYWDNRPGGTVAGTTTGRVGTSGYGARIQGIGKGTFTVLLARKKSHKNANVAPKKKYVWVVRP